MKRVRRSTSDRVKLFEKHGGICHICSGKIHVGQAWEWSHPTPLELGGDDDLINAAPAHKTCHRKVTSEEDIPRIAKAKRREARNIGARAPSSRPIPGSKRSPWKAHLDGTFSRRQP